MPEVRTEGLTKKFGEVIPVDSMNLIVEDGKLTVLLGPSGCGKTTTMRCIAGLETPDEGKISIGDNLVYSKVDGKNVPTEKRDIGMVFQSYAIWPQMTVFQNIAFPLKLRRMPRKKIIEKVKEVLDTAKLEGLENRYPDEISGGQQQRVALGRAIIYEPKLLLLDEPLANLDAKVREEMRFELKALQQKTGITMIYVTHDQTEALVISDKLVVMKEGKLIQEGNPYEVYTHPVNEFIANFLGLCNLIEGRVVQTGRNGVIEGLDNLRIYVNIDSNLLGRKVLLAIRPEDFHIMEEKSADEKNVWEARVEKRAFMGSIIDYWVVIGGRSYRIQGNAHAPFEVGKEFYVKLNEKWNNIIPQ